MRFDKFRVTVSLCAILGISAPAAHAAAVFSEDFDTGSATFTADPYWTEVSQDNGTVRQDSGINPFPSNQIPQDASGSGFFLFEGTSRDNPNPSNSQFYISPTFAVTANTNYTVSFELTNADALAPASVRPEIDGVPLGSSPVSAVGSYDLGNEWQIFSFTWNSGSDTSTSLVLNDFTFVGDGNDFGIDDILVQPVSDAVPEPTSLLLLTTGLGGLIWSRRRRGAGRAAG